MIPKLFSFNRQIRIILKKKFDRFFFGRHIFLRALLAFILLAFAGCGASRRQETTPAQELPYLNKEFELDVRWGASPRTVMLRLFDMAKLTSSDIFYDLGCGDGRVVVEAVKRYGLVGKGVDIDPARIIQSKERAEKNGVKIKQSFSMKAFSIPIFPMQP